MGAHNHGFAAEDVAVKFKEKDWFRHGKAEAIWVANGKASLNRDRGRHTLYPLYPSTTNCCRHVTLTLHRDDMETADN